MKRRVALKQNNNKGFTLVELLVVLVLMAILLSISIFSALGWIDWSKFRHQNAAAEDIFYAAQNQLTELDSSGALIKKVQDALWDEGAAINYYEDRDDDSYRKGNYNSAYILAQGKNSIDAEGEGAGLSTRFGNLKNSDGQPYAWDSSLWKDNNLANAKRTILTLSVAAGRYNKYSNKANSGEAITPGEKLLFDLIAPYIADKSVLNGSITIEFSPEAGQVFAVCYSDQADSFTYNMSSSGNEVSIADRNINTREAVMLGYYGVDTLTPKVRGRSRTVQAYRLEIDNGDTLNLKLGTISNNTNMLTDISVKYIIYGSSTYENDNKKYDEVMSFTIPKAEIDKIRSYRSVEQAAQDPVNDIEVTFNKGLYANLSGKKFRMPMWLDDKGNIYLALDAADIQAQSVTYAKTYGYFEDGEAANDTIKTAKVNEAQAAFSKTFSFYRFGLPNVRYINAKVIINPNTEKQGEAVSGPLVGSDGVFVEHGIDTDKPHGTAVTFDDWKEEDASVEGGNDPLVTDKSYVYGIKNGRHFYNMRFESDYSDFIEKTTYVHENIKKTFDLRADIDWKEFSEKAFLSSYILRSSNDSTDTDLTSGIDVCADVNRYELTYKDEDGSIIVPGFDTSKYPFPGFRMLSFGDTFKTETDETDPDKCFKLSNINITVAANSIYGVYGDTVRKNMDQIKDAKNYNYEAVNELSVAGGMPLGLFAENFGSIHDINLEKVNIKGVEGFPVSDSANPEGFIYTSKVGGFVGENFGTVQKLYIDKKEAGTEGSSQNDSETLSYISGRSDVGGIIGHQYFKAVANNDNGEVNADIKDCINNADVTGISYVGGIIGRVYMADSTGDGERSNYFDTSFSVNGDSGVMFSKRYIAPSVSFSASKYNIKNIDTFTIESCTNRGEVSMHSDFVENTIPGYEMKRGFYFGGITGAAFNSVNSQNVAHAFDSDENDNLLIKDCDSCVLFSESDLMEILNPDMEDSEQLSETRRRLRQTFVGGIVGGIRYGTIEDCTTTPGTVEGEDKYSFVFGDRYVGGIAGYSLETVFTGSSDFIQGETEKNGDISNIASKTGHTYRVVNGTGAFGNYAIGGIAGAFGTPETSGLSPNFVGREIETAFSENDNYEYPVNAKCISNSGYTGSGYLNTSLVLGYSFDGKLNKLNGGTNDINPTVGKYFYGVGGITGLLAETINSSDYVQSEETKNKYLELICLNNIEYEREAKDLSNISSMLGSDSFSIDALRSIIRTSEFTTDGVGGIAGHALEGGNLNKINENTRYNSCIDALVVGRNRVGGAVGDTVAYSDGKSSISNVLPSIVNDSGSGLYVLGNENVGGLVGVFSDNGRSNSAPATLNGDNDYDSGKIINSKYHVIGYRAVGGLIGTCYRYQGSTSSRPSIRAVINPGSAGASVVIKGGMYVGGVVGIQEGFTDTLRNNAYVNPARYSVEMHFTNIQGECFAGVIAGAIFSSNGTYWPLDNLMTGGRDKIGNKVTVNTEVAGSFVTGIYAYLNYENDEEDSSRLIVDEQSVIVNDKTSSGDEYANYKPYNEQSSYVSRNGIYNIKDIRNLSYDPEAALIDSVNDIKNAYDRYQTFSYVYHPNQAKSYMDMTKLSQEVQQGGDNHCFITSYIYAGSLCGYVPKNTYISIANYKSRAVLRTIEAIQSQEAGSGDNSYYSYLGGITGKIPVGMSVKNCWNTSAESATADVNDTGQRGFYNSKEATFKGQVTEVNAGVIEGNTSSKQADIKSMTGDGNGVFNKCKGVYAGLNGTTETDGINSGVIKDCINDAFKEGSSIYNGVPIKANIAGGIAGAIGGSSLIKNCVNKGNITGVNDGDEYGQTGGIVGIVLPCVEDADIYIENCINTGSVKSSDTASDNVHSAGIIYDSHKLANIWLCRNYGSNSYYAITSVEEDKTAASIYYCLDASSPSAVQNNITNKKNVDIVNRTAGFGKIDGELPSDFMYSNFYLGNNTETIDDNIPMLDVVRTGTFAANQFYGTEKISQNRLTGIDETNAEKSRIDDYVYADSNIDYSADDNTGGHDIQSSPEDPPCKWAPTRDNNGTTENLTYEIVPATEEGDYINAYTGMKQFSIVWDNYLKTEIGKLYNSIDFSDTGATEGSDYQAFAGNGVSSMNSSTGLGASNVLGEPVISVPEVIETEVIEPGLNEDGEITEEPIMQDSEIPEADETEGSVEGDDMNAGAGEGEGDEGTSTTKSVKDIAMEAYGSAEPLSGYSINLLSYYIKPDDSSDKYLEKYLYTMYLYYKEQNGSAPTTDDQASIDSYIKMLYDYACYINSKSAAEVNESKAGLDISYRLLISDINYNYVSTAPITASLTGDNSYYKASVIDLTKLSGISKDRATNVSGLTNDTSSAVSVYKNGDFNIDRINKIYVVIESSVPDKNNGNNDVAVRAFECIGTDEESSSVMKSSGAESLNGNVFEDASSLNDLLNIIDTNKVSLTKLYKFQNDTDISMDVKLYKFNTGMSYAGEQTIDEQGNPKIVYTYDDFKKIDKEYLNFIKPICDGAEQALADFANFYAN